MVQVWGLDYCSGYGDLDSECEYLGTKECGGQNIRKLILRANIQKMVFQTPQIEKGDSMENKKIFVLIKNYMGVNDDADVLINFEAAKRAFLKYTGFAFQRPIPESRKRRL